MVCKRENSHKYISKCSSGSEGCESSNGFEFSLTFACRVSCPSRSSTRQILREIGAGASEGAGAVVKIEVQERI